ncbi:MAG: hypothetical protein HY303_09260 [Candidatus Wallbacteria bacterium]|nr:hypothetical protein [Candidatus Wallbacteria bacterium]
MFGAALLTSCCVFAVSCASNYGGDFLPDKKSNVALRQFVTVNTSGTGAATTGGTAAGGNGSIRPANGGTEGPTGGNPTSFNFQFDPFPNGADLLLNRKVGTSVADVTSDNRQTIVNIEVTFIGHDVNNNRLPPITRFLAATGQPELTQVGTGGTGTTGTNATAGQQVSVLRPQTASFTSTVGSAQVLEFFPPVAAQFTITNGISFTIDQIKLRYREPDGSLAVISEFMTPNDEEVRRGISLGFFMEANPIDTGLGASSGGAAGAGR